MTEWRDVVQYTGSVVALGGLLLATTFIGVRTADPVAGVFIDLTVRRQAVGVLAGPLLFSVGVGTARLAMPEEEKQS